MSELDKLLEELRGNRVPLSDLLFSAKEFAFKQKKEELLSWIDCELKGYPKNIKVPEYRIVPCQIKGTISDGYRLLNNFPIPIATDNNKVNKAIGHWELIQSVSALEKAVDSNGVIAHQIPASGLSILNEILEEGFQLQTARREISKIQVIEVLTNVRHKLFEELLEFNSNSASKVIKKSIMKKRSKGIKTHNIFISHSSKDADLVKKFIDLLILGFGVRKEDIFCTSIHSTNVKSGEDFKKAIQEELKGAEIVFQLITTNYKKSEVCLNEMGAAWVTSSIVVPLIAGPFTYDIGFIHASTQQPKLNNKEDIMKLYDDYKPTVFTNHVSITDMHKEIDSFVKYVVKREQDILLQNKNKFFYKDKNTICGLLKEGIFKHPPGETSSHDSYHRYYYLELEEAIDVLTSEKPDEGNPNVSHFNITKVQLIPDKVDLKKLVGKTLEATGFFMGWLTAWHQTEVMLGCSEVKVIV